MLKLTCKRCGHSWINRTEKPKVCPKCHSAYWDTEKRIRKDGEVKE